jgi:hypothetical protein
MSIGAKSGSTNTFSTSVNVLNRRQPIQVAKLNLSLHTHVLNEAILPKSYLISY